MVYYQEIYLEQEDDGLWKLQTPLPKKLEVPLDRTMDTIVDQGFCHPIHTRFRATGTMYSDSETAHQLFRNAGLAPKDESEQQTKLIKQICRHAEVRKFFVTTGWHQPQIPLIVFVKALPNPTEQLQAFKKGVASRELES
ncbi:hypothetical protein JX265_003845 [Neoarthrinium moseri]|uniref:Uncharacterized protein n=1 Tax=Neoarthrinium moseri TaxID=1658444 RepID=A0A9P9WRB1_9PEZI|nr:uncharacterized protein JN550_009408 [Neoarthrinium moseri]KAI1863708.1 hypothetical protein JN550_009408 [Neoarthrinium moseri]KAI1876319.1 hypothetical protein JX265_003845 [Neoarthrinium moseri]